VGNERVSMELMGSATRLRQGYGAPSIEGKVARVATSKLGNERVSITKPAPNLGVILGRCLQCGLLAMELMGSAIHLRQGYGAPSIEGKVTRVGASEWSRGDASDIDGQTERSK